MAQQELQRCNWVGSDPIYQAYHDEEWGVPERDSRALWEKLVLDGFQAGLSWITILKKRDNFRNAFNGFDPHAIAGWGEAEVQALLGDPGIIRHRGKIEATIGNARAWMEIEAREGFDQFLWRYVDGVALQPRFATQAEVPPRRLCRNRCPRICARPASGSSARPSFMPSWRPAAWSTTISWGAIVTTAWRR